VKKKTELEQAEEEYRTARAYTHTRNLFELADELTRTQTKLISLYNEQKTQGVTIMIEELEQAFTAWYQLMQRDNETAEEITELNMAEGKYRTLHQAVFPEDYDYFKKIFREAEVLEGLPMPFWVAKHFGAKIK